LGWRVIYLPVGADLLYRLPEFPSPGDKLQNQPIFQQLKPGLEW
jgi:hypothetical protein